MPKFIFATVVFLAFTASFMHARSYTYADLVKRMYDLPALSLLPEKGTYAHQSTSYDRRSQYDSNTHSYIHWDANADGNGYLYKESNLFVLAEMKGPGVIWKIWSAYAGKGHVKIYIDGAEKPTVDLPFHKYFDHSIEPFNFPALVYHTARGGVNNYIPIPYASSCKIVAEKDWGNYYYFVYQTFPPHTIVPSFSMDLDADALHALRTANRKLSTELGDYPISLPANTQTITKNIMVQPGQTGILANISGSHAIAALYLAPTFPHHTSAAEVLRECCIQITFDTADSPQVWAPLGDFFGTAPGINYYTSLVMGMTSNSFYSYWYMPFQSNALVHVINEGNSPLSIASRIMHTPLLYPIQSSAYFHAVWHRDAFLPENPERRAIDWTILSTKGHGRYCGTMLHIWNPLGGWWGEGDEKFFIDGESFPSFFGTGSEDYFGYAWCASDLFQSPWLNQTINECDNKGNISVN